MKKFLCMTLMLLSVMVAKAQFEEEKFYVGGSLTGLDLSYSGADKFKLGVEAKAGYLFRDNLMALAQIGYQHIGDSEIGANSFNIGVGGRYYIIQNGLFLGVNATYEHANHFDDFKPGAEVGYAFFINKSVTIEPSVYYNPSFKNSDYSKVGLKIGIGIYLDPND